MDISLTQLLASRDERRAKQMKLMKENPGTTLVVLTVIMPGSEKRNDISLLTAEAAVEAIGDKFGDKIVKKVCRDLLTGYEGYFMVDMPVIEAKEMSCSIEDTHKLGRLFDIDVFDAEGFPVSRESVGHKARKCLICDNDARYCMRSHSHTPDEIMERIRDIVADYKMKKTYKPE